MRSRWKSMIESCSTWWKNSTFVGKPMPSNLVLRTLAHSWRVLEPLGMPMAVMGGIALSAWKHVRATQDVDLLIGIGKADLNVVLRQLAGGQIRPKQDPPVMPLCQ